MENVYNDAMLPDDFEQIAKAYSKALKNKGFVFVRLEEEEFHLLIAEIFVLIGKMQAALQRMSKVLDGKKLFAALDDAKNLLSQKFGKTKTDKFKCLEGENNAFLALVSLENLLVIKLMLLSVKSGELELCNSIITSVAGIFAESFSTEGFCLAENSSKHN